jgi:hypothetical protein
MRRIAHLTQVFLLAGLTVVIGSTSAWAAPANDDIAGAVVIPGLPFTHRVNTTEATVAPSDPTTACSGPTATVWYTFTATETTRVQVDTVGSDYATTLGVFTGTLAQLTEVTCSGGGPNSTVRFDVTAGTEYFVMAGPCCDAPVGGNLVVHADVAPPSPVIDVTLDGRGVVTNAGRTTITGSVRCNVAGEAALGIELVQRHGRLVARGSGGVSVACGPTPTAWSLQVDSFTEVAFRPGQTEVTVSELICTVFECTTGQTTGIIQLRRA